MNCEWFPKYSDILGYRDRKKDSQTENWDREGDRLGHILVGKRSRERERKNVLTGQFGIETQKESQKRKRKR